MRAIEYKGRMCSMTEASKLSGVPKDTIRNRYFELHMRGPDLFLTAKDLRNKFKGDSKNDL